MVIALGAAAALDASPALAATRTCTFSQYIGGYYTWYANCDGNLAIEQASGRYIRQLTTHYGANYYTLTSAPTTNAISTFGSGEMRAYVGGYTLNSSGDGVACTNTGGNVYYCSWG